MGQPAESGARGKGFFHIDFRRGGRAKEAPVVPPNPLDTALGVVEEALGEVRRQNVFKGGEAYRETAAEIVLSTVLGQAHAYQDSLQAGGAADDARLAFIGGTSPKIVRDPILDYITQHYLDHPVEPWGPNNPRHDFAGFRSIIAGHSAQPLQFNNDAVDYLMTYMRNQVRGGNGVVFFGANPHLEQEYPTVDWQALGLPEVPGNGDAFPLLQEQAWNNRLQQAIGAGGGNGINVVAPDGRQYHLIHLNGLVACASEPVAKEAPQVKKLAFLTSRAALQGAGLIQ